MDVPNIPESMGNRGFSMFKLKTAIPKTPDRIKIIAAQSIDFVSLTIKYTERIINEYPIKGIINGQKVSTEIKNIGIASIEINREQREPIIVKKTASYPFPCKRNLCPGSMERTTSESGAPRKIEGIVSKKV